MPAGNTQDVSSGHRHHCRGPIGPIDTNSNTVAFGSGLSGNGRPDQARRRHAHAQRHEYLLGNDAASAGGTLQLGTGNPNALPGGAVTANAGFLDLNGNSPTISSLNGAAGTITNSTGPQATLTLNQTTPSTFGGSLQDGSGGLGLTMNGPSTLTLAGVNTYSYPTTSMRGVLKAGAADAFSPNSNIVINSGTLDATNSPQSIFSLTMGGAGAVNLAIGNLLTSNNLDSINDSFGGTLNLYLLRGTSAGAELITYTCLHRQLCNG